LLRYGGDEFLCELSEVQIEHAERRLAEVSDILGEAPSNGSIAWGLSALRADDTVDSLVARADSALLVARRSQRGRPPSLL
jgi:GGDEF domain-containing protein